jgi:hypothetical protein
LTFSAERPAGCILIPAGFFSDMGNLLITGIAAIEHSADPVLFCDLSEVKAVDGIGYPANVTPL